MYKLIPQKYGLIAFGLLALLVFVISNPTGYEGLIPFCKSSYGAVSLAAFILFIFGQTPIFPLICRLPIFNKIFPDIDGDWVATMESNWPEIAKRLDPPSNPTVVSKVGKIRIEQRLFTVTMVLDMDDKYTKSHTIFVRPRRCPSSGRLQLHYIYEAQTMVPVATDSSSHSGAACLDILKDGDNTLMKGVYWTDRNWTKGLNTAGAITLERAK